MLAVLRGIAAFVVAFLIGRPMARRARERRWLSRATYLRGGRRVAVQRFSVHWYAWPGWQRSVARLVELGVLAAAYLWPMWTAVAGVLLVGTVSGVAYRVRRRPRPAVTVGEPIRVPAVTR